MMVICDKCKKEFKVKPRTKKIEDDLELCYFRCPKCLKTYTAYHTNTKVRELKEKLNKAKGKAYKMLLKEYQKEYNKINIKE